MSNDKRSGPPRRVHYPARRSQAGQAMVEAVFMFALVLALVTAGAAVGRLQWKVLRSDNQSRFIAFSFAKGEPPDSRDASGPPAGLAGSQATRAVSQFLQVGGTAAASAALRREWKAEDEGIVTGRSGHSRLSLLAGAGHATDDAAAAERVGSSPSGWANAARLSLDASKSANARIGGIDNGWRRAKPSYDWLQPWRDLPTRLHANPSPRTGSSATPPWSAP
jgi:hypothetical protein